MLFLIGFLIAGLIIYSLIRGVSGNPTKARRLSKYMLYAAGIVVAILLLRFGMPLIAATMAAIMALAPYLGRIMQIISALRLFKNMTGKPQGTPHSKQKQPAMSAAQAREILGVSDTASKMEIKAAYQRLMKKVHPDTGGSKYLASQLNQARDVLLGE